MMKTRSQQKVGTRNRSFKRRGAVQRIILSLAVCVCLMIAGWLIATGGCSDPTAKQRSR